MQFKELLREYNIRYETEGKYSRPGWIQFRCPFCMSGSDPHKLYMGFNLQFGYCNCWRCGKHSIASVISELAGIPFYNAKQLTEGIEIEHRGPVEKLQGKLVLPKAIGPLLPVHKKYLRGRGFDPAEIARLWNVGGIGLSSRFAWRLYIPIYLHGEQVSWTTRATREDGSRYISAGLAEESYPHKSLLYGEEYCRHAVIVHEGPTDVWATGPGAVATMGVLVSRSQVLRLSKYLTRVICFDNEPEAQRRARRLADLLTPFPGETYNVVLDAKDAGSSDEIWKLREQFLT